MIEHIYKCVFVGLSYKYTIIIIIIIIIMATNLILSAAMNINNDKIKILINIIPDKRRYKNKIRTNFPDKHIS